MKRLALVGLLMAALAGACGSGEIVPTSTASPISPGRAAQLDALAAARLL